MADNMPRAEVKWRIRTSRPIIIDVMIGLKATLQTHAPAETRIPFELRPPYWNSAIALTCGDKPHRIRSLFSRHRGMLGSAKKMANSYTGGAIVISPSRFF